MGKSNFFTGQPVFSQLFRLLPRYIISSCSRSHASDRYYKKFNTHHHLITMLYACYQNCTSLREVVTGMKACEGRLQSLGLKHLPTKSTLSEANKNRSYEVFEQIYYKLLERYRKILPDSQNTDPYFNRLVIIDSTTISLFKEILKNAGCTGANGRRKGGIKVHMAVQAREDIPYFIKFTAAASNDAPFMKDLNPPRGSIVVMDRGYNGFHWLNQWTSSGVEWVTRLRKNTSYEVTGIIPVSDQDRNQGVVKDELITMGFPKKPIEQVQCRLITYFDPISERFFRFITSSKHWSPLTIASIYKQRWQIELLFKRLKQNMPLQYFLGDNENAIKVQIFCALIADILLKIATKGIKRRWAFSNLAAFVRLHLMNYTHLQRFLEHPDKCKIYNPAPESAQLLLKLSG